MRSPQSPHVLVALVGMSLFLWLLACSIGLGETATDPIRGLLSIGGVETNPIGLHIRTVKLDGSPAAPGDQIVLRVKADRKGYLFVIFVSPDEGATVLFPNEKTPDNLIQPGKEYTVGKPERGTFIRLGDGKPSGKLVFYISPSPLALSPMKIAKGGGFLKILRTSPDRAKTLAGKLERAAGKEGFNRVVLEKQVQLIGEPLNLMGAPPGTKHGRPGSTSGVQGLKDRVRTLGQE